MDLGLTGKVVLVAGASRGIGLATARLFAEEGARLMMVARDGDALEAARAEVVGGGVRGEVRAAPADITTVAGAEAAVAAAKEAWGGLDVLVSAVGQGMRSTLASAAPELWEENWRTNLLSAGNLTRVARPALAKASGGRVVLLGAASGIQPTPGQLVSNVNKAALIALGKSLALELAPEGIRVNVVCPGRILTERRLKRAHDEARDAGVAVEDQLGRVAGTVPLGSWGRPEEVAAVIVFLCSSPAAYVTGQVVCVDGGLVRTVFP